MLNIGDRVMCPYSIEGTVEGFLSPEDVFVRVEKKDYKIKGKKVVTEIHSVRHVYGIKLLRKV